ncbi:hypothetical protein GCM10010359_48430 [Streptomyces morookaense]|nr:hypothetical protein GCM10010359_48430 [Streptomyces morookaense]
MRELTDSQAASPFVSKFWGQYHAVKLAAAKLAANASIVLMSGAAGVRLPGRPPPTWPATPRSRDSGAASQPKGNGS